MNDEELVEGAAMRERLYWIEFCILSALGGAVGGLLVLLVRKVVETL